MTETDRLSVFLYVLLRDHVPFGTVELILRDHVDAAQNVGGELLFSEAYQEAYVRRLAQRVLGKE